MQRWVGVGNSDLSDARAAGAAAATAALAGRDASLVVVFASDGYDLHQLVGSIHATSGRAPLIGCSTAGEISSNGPGGSSVVVAAFGGSGFSVSTASVGGASGRLREASAEVATCAERLGHGSHKVLMMLTDGLGGDQTEVVRGAYSVVGAAVPLVGGCAGDDLKMRRTYQFHDGEVLSDGIVAAAVSSDAPFGIGVRHGWRKVGDPMLVTQSDGNRVYTLDDEPALDVYLRRLDAPSRARREPAEFTRFAMTHPLGLSRRSGEEVRFVAEANMDDRSLGCIAGVPQGGLAWLMEGDDASVLHATDGACQDALRSLGGRPPLGLLAFDCIARRGVLGESIRSEVERIGRHAGDAPVAGFYTYGEFARTHGITGFHNQTLVVLAVG